MKQNASRARFTRVALLLVSSAGLYAQSTDAGQISGRVTSGGKPIPQATVLIRAPQLISPRTVKTDENGNYRAPLLPVGDYTVTVTAAGFETYQNKTAIRIGIGTQIRQNIELTSPSTTVVVTASVGTLDKSDPKVAVNYSAETLLSLPTINRSFEGAVDLAPGVVTGPLGVGSTTIRGGKGFQAIYLLDGVAVGDEVNGVSASSSTRFLVEDSVEDTQVILSPLHGKYGRTGAGLINVATKTGGNDFAGSLRWNLTRNDWAANRPFSLGQLNADDFYATRDLDIFLSGPIWKNHIWFAFSNIQSPSTNTPETINLGTDPSTWGLKRNPLLFSATGHTLAWAAGTNPASQGLGPLAVGSAAGFDTGKSFTQTNSSKFYNGKITFAVTPDHTITIERTYNKFEISNATYAEFGITASLPTTLVPDQLINSYNALSYKGSLASNWYLEAGISEKKYLHSNGPATPFLHVRLYQSGQGGQIWPYGTNINGGVVQNNGNTAGSFNLKYIGDWHGSHEVDFGYQYNESAHGTQGFTGLNNQRFYVYGDTTNAALLSAAGVTTPDIFGNTVGYLAANWAETRSASAGSSSGVAPMRRYYTGRDGIARSRDEGIYVTDTWNPDSHWTYLGALRMDKIRVGDTTGEVISKYNASLSPRFQVKFDPKGDASHVFSASVAKFVTDVSPAYIENLIHFGSSDFINYGWSANAANTVTWVPYSKLIDPANYNYTISTVVGSSLNLNDGVRSPYLIEASLGYRRNRADGSYVGITLVNRDWYNDLAIKQDTNLSALAAFDATGAIPSDWVQTGVSASGSPTYGLPRHFFNSQDLKRNYKAVEIEFKQVVNPRINFGGSFTWSRLTGNDNGGDAPGEPTFANNANPSALTVVSEYYTFRNVLLAQGWNGEQISSYGPLVVDSTHKARLYLTYNLPVGKDGNVSFALLGRYDSGLTFAAQDGFSGNYNGTGLDVPVLPDFSGASPAPNQLLSTFSPYTSARGAFRQNDTHQVDFTLNFNIPIVSKVKFIAKLDISNIFNQTMNAFYNDYFAADPRVHPNDVAGYSGLAVQDPSIFGTGNKGSGYGDRTYYLFGRSWNLSAGIKF